MKTFVLTDTRKAGVDWLEKNIPPTSEERRRTQTEIQYKNGDTTSVIQKFEQLGPINSSARLIIATPVQDVIVNKIVEVYNRSGYNLVVEQQGMVLTATDLKRRALMEQMEDLEREDRLRAYFKDLNLNGIQITKTDVNVGNRAFTVVLTGKFV